MSNVSKPCNPIPGSDAVLKAYDDCNLEFDLAISDLPNIPLVDIQAAIEASPTIATLRAKDTQLQTQITDIKSGDVSNLDNRLTSDEWEISNIKSKDDEQDALIAEMSDDIAMLKGWNVRQDAGIKSASRNVIIDETYNNFDEWIENVYIPQSEETVNKYSRWDIYINTNPSMEAVNATYINRRTPNATSEFSAADWELLKYAAPADVITYLWIEPLVVSHPNKHEWSVSIDEDKFIRFMWWLERLDLSNVKVTLWNVYFKQVVEDDLKVEWETETKTLKVTDSVALPASITIDGESFENWLVAFGNQHWQQI